jgi:hypothetical protein
MTASRRWRWSALSVVLIVRLATAAPAAAAPARPAPALAGPGGKIVRVSTEPELQAAVSALSSNTTIVLTPGIYRLTRTLYVKGSMTRVGLRGSTDRADDVVIIGPGMTNVRYGDAPYGIWTGGDVRGITIANLTIRDFYLHPIIFNAGTVAPHLYNVRLVNAGQQFVKANPSADGRGVDDGLVEYTVIEYDTGSKDDYTNGVDVHGGRNWTIRNSLFRNIRAPIGALAGPAILMWNGASNTTVEGNTFVNCQREIAFGLIDRAPYDHAGGVVRNNFIYRDRGVPGDAAIGVFASPRTQVLHNTILISGTYPHAIEYRFARTNGVAIRNNLLDADVRPRDGATALVSGNSTTGTASMFVNAPAGDLHLAPAASVSRGIPLQEVPVDWDGEPRGQGATEAGADHPIATARQSSLRRP